MNRRMASENRAKETVNEQLKAFFREFSIPLSQAEHFFTKLSAFVEIPDELRNAAEMLQGPMPQSHSPPKSSIPHKKRSASTAPRSEGRKRVAKTTDHHRERLLEIEEELQSRLDAVSEECQAMNQFRMEIGKCRSHFAVIHPFENLSVVGEGVLCLSHGYYYECEVISRGPGHEIEGEPGRRTQNMYSVRFKGWSKRYDALVAENNLIMRKTKAGFANVFGMLFAHEWNTFHYASAGLEEKDLGRGFWLLSDDIYTELEAGWRRETKQPVGFAEFCGRT